MIKQEGQVQILRIERRVRADQYRIDCGEFGFGLTDEGVSQRSANAEHRSVAELSDTVGQY